MTRSMSEVVGRLRRALMPSGRTCGGDEELLHRFAVSRDETAFETLVRRHGPMVWGVCRRVLGNHHDAEDAFQATFLVLAKKADSIRSRDLLANWLYGVAHNVARKARAIAGKRAVRERLVDQMPEPAVAEANRWEELQPLLDEELSRLPDRYRVCIVLCDLEGKTRKEAAEYLGVPEGTVASRVARAREMLAERLAKNGVLSYTVAPVCVPASLLSATVKAATLFVAGEAAEQISVHVVALTEGVMKAMLLRKIKIVTAVLLMLGLFGLGGGLVAYRSAADEQTKAEKPSTGGKVEDPVKKDLDLLQGEWNIVKFEMEGKSPPKEFIDKGKYVFKGDLLTIMEDGKKVGVARLSLDPAKKPKTLDMTATEGSDKGKKVYGIYRIEKDTLLLCIGDKRPTEFSGVGKAGLLELKRASKTPARDAKKEKPAVNDGKLWAAISVTQPVFRVGELLNVDSDFPRLGKAPQIEINFALVNDGDETIDLELKSSRLIVNGKEVKEWGVVVSSGNIWPELKPKDHRSFTCALGKHPFSADFHGIGIPSHCWWARSVMPSSATHAV